MPAFQKAEFCKESTEAFKKQRESCLKAGVRIRPVQRQGLEDSNRVDSGKIGIALQNTPGTNMLGTSFKIVGPAKGQGSFGAVYVVEHVHSRRRYAAKVEPVLASLDREIQILKGISHEAILPVLCSHVEDGGLSWYIMPLLPTNLFAYLRSENQFAHGSQDALFNQLMDLVFSMTAVSFMPTLNLAISFTTQGRSTSTSSTSGLLWSCLPHVAKRLRASTLWHFDRPS